MDISQTHRIKYEIVRDAAGLTYGKNHWDYVDPRLVTTLSQVIGNAGVNLTDYAAFKNYDFSIELTDRQEEVRNFQTIHFVDRRLLGLSPYHITEDWTTPYEI